MLRNTTREDATQMYEVDSNLKIGGFSSRIVTGGWDKSLKEIYHI